MRRSLAERLWEKVERRDPDECWPWTAYVRPSGYACIRRGAPERGEIGVHVAAFILTYGPVPDGREIDHTCDNPICCNPAHLRAATHAENCARRRKGHPRAASHCTHERTPENTYTEPKTGYTRCRLCHAASMRRRYERLRAAA